MMGPATRFPLPDCLEIPEPVRFERMKKNVSGSVAPSPPAPDPVVRKRRIFLVDDHPVTRRGVAVLISQDSDLEVCGEAATAPQAFELVQKLKPDLVIVDISLTSSSGLELIKNLRAAQPGLPLLVVSMHDEALYADRAVRAGAMGYVMKHEASEKVLTAIRAVLKGDFYLSATITVKMMNRLVGNRQAEVAVSPIDSLSDREMEVLQLVGNGFSTSEIAARLNLSVKTIDSYREHLKLKLNVDSGAALVRYAIHWVKSGTGA